MVAIIAILAAIAVPNFLEAQVRSKISRAKSDMRTVNVALETYLIDNNKVPPDCNDWGNMPPWYKSVDQEYPNRQVDALNINDNPKPFLGSRAFCEWVPLTTPIAYMTSVPIEPFSSWVPLAYETWMDYSNKFAFSAFYSWGPDRRIQPSPVTNYPNNIYDPTNGTTSNGDILRFATVKNTGFVKTVCGVMPPLAPQ